jgi:signal transduction histidine kinase
VFSSQDGDLSLVTAEAITKFDDERGIELLVAALRSDDELKRISAAVALGGIGDARARNSLLEILDQRGHRERWRAADALAAIGDERAVGELLSLFSHTDEFVRERAAEALLKIPGESLAAGLLKSLSHEDGGVRKRAIRVVGYYSNTDGVLEELLRLASSDPLDELRREASDARFRFYRKLRYFNRETGALDRAEEIGREISLEDTRAFIAHEVKNAIVPLRIYAQLLIESMSGDSDLEKAPELANRIIKQTDRAYDVVTQIVDYSRPFAPKFERADVNHLLSEATNEVREQCAQSKICIREELGRVAPVSIDRIDMAQALQNILLNAVQSMEGGGTLSVTSRQDGARVVVDISDTGKGVKAEDLPRVFDLGFTTKAGQHGSGIGLARVRRIVEEEHAGAVRMANNVDRGATVSVFLPQAPRED